MWTVGHCPKLFAYGKQICYNCAHGATGDQCPPYAKIDLQCGASFYKRCMDADAGRFVNCTS